MSVIRADDLRNLTNNDLRERLRRQFHRHTGFNVNKTQLVGRLLIAHAEADPTATIIGTFYDLLPRNGRYHDEKGLGLVSNFPLSYQEKVCNALAEELRGSYYPCALDIKFRQFPDNNDTTHPMVASEPRAVIRHLVQDVMTRWENVAELTAYYTGFTRTAFVNDTWTWTPDEKGRVFVDVLTDYILMRWNKAVEKRIQDMARSTTPIGSLTTRSSTCPPKSRPWSEIPASETSRSVGSAAPCAPPSCMAVLASRAGRLTSPSLVPAMPMGPSASKSPSTSEPSTHKNQKNTCTSAHTHTPHRKPKKN